MKISLSIILSCLFMLSSAQNIPQFLKITLPTLTSEYQGTLGVTDGQNFKDGSYLDVVQYEGQAGDIVIISARSDAFDTFLSLYHPDGYLLNSNDDSSYSSNEDYSTNSSIFVELPDTGRYIVVISGYSEFDVGDYSLSARSLEGMQGTTFTGPGEAISSLSEDDYDDEGRISQSYTLSVPEAGQYIIDMFSPEMDTYLYLYDGDELITENDDGPTSADSQIVIYLDPGEYTIVASSYGQSETGIYLLAVTEE